MRLPSIAVADHQAAQLSTGISIRLRLSWAPGTIYKANRIGFSPHGRQRPIAARETNVNRAKKKMLYSTKRQFDSLVNGRCDVGELRRLSPLLALLREMWKYFKGRFEEKQWFLCVHYPHCRRDSWVKAWLFLLLSCETWSLSSESMIEYLLTGWCSVEVVILCGDQSFV